MKKREQELAGLKKLDPHQMELYTVEGFDRVFIRNSCYYSSREQAYEATERQYEFIFGCRRYNSYDAFRVARNRRLKLTIKKRARK